MANVTLEQIRAARQAAERAETLLLELLATNQLYGSVCIEVTPPGLQVIKRTEDRRGLIKVGRGREVEVERI